MKPKFVSLFKLLVTAMAISATAGCASVQTAFAPGMVAQAKAAGSEAISADSVDLVPGSVDLSISSNASRPVHSGALVPGSLDLSISNTGPRLAYSGALVPGSVDLSSTPAGAATNGTLTPPTDQMFRFRR